MTDLEREYMERCRHTDNGHCPSHSVLEERRKQDSKLLEAIPGILTVQNRIIGGTRVISLVFILIVTAAFLYMKETKTSLEAAVAKNQTDYIRLLDKLETVHDKSLGKINDDLKKHKDEQANLVKVMENLTVTIEKTYNKL